MTESTSLIAKELKELYVKRSSVKGRITKYKTYLNSITSTNLTSLEVGELKLKTDKIKTVSEYFDELQNRIEVLNSDNLSLELAERDSIEQDFAITIATGLHLIESSESVLNSSRHTAARDDRGDQSTSIICHHDNQDMGFKLPQIQIAKFDGAFFKWLEFRDTFLSLIHTNERIKAIHKFHYLVSYLEGEAARIISNIELSEANYSNAWQLLCERYDNKKQLINHHLNSLFSIEPLARETEKSLRFLIDHVSKNLRALATLGQPTEYWDTLIIHLVSSKLDNVTLGKWEERRNTFDEIPTLKQFNKFLSDRADILETMNRNKSDKLKQQSRSTVAPSRSYNNNYNNERTKNNYNYNHEHQLKSFTVSNNTNSFRCSVCKGEHRIYDCPTFLAMNIEDRKAEVSKLRLCPNCLRSATHTLRFCPSRACRQCTNKFHNTLLCYKQNKNATAPANKSTSTNLQNNNDAVVNCSSSTQHVNQIILSTALITVTNPKTNQTETVKALLDCGSQSTFLSQSIKKRLSLDSQQINTINVIGIGDTQCNTVTETCAAQLNSINNDFHISLTCYVMDKLTGNIPKIPINIHDLKLPTGIRLADPTFDQPAPIDVLIGADIFWDILGCEQLSLGPDNPKLRSSKFGWLIAGPLANAIIDTKNNQRLANIAHVDEIDKQLSKFWELESVPLNPILSKNETACEDHFLRNTYRLSTGRFCVKLPLTKDPTCLGDSYNLAKQRFINLEKRLRKQPVIKSQYIDFMREYAELGHLQKSEISRPNPSYFLCHHAVFKANSESTKIRVVFDGSARVPSSGLSINDIQLTGPNIQDSLLSILIRARQYKFILTGDIEKMYRQIQIDEAHRDLQLILWREDESLPLETHRLNTVTYGFASASYLSTRCIWQLGEECDDEQIKTIIQHDFYVDDLITGADDEQSVLNIQKSVSEALKKGCFNLRKYRSNSKAIYESSNIDFTENLSISESSSTLGLGWNPNSDTLHLTIDLPLKNEVLTKRIILSSSFKIFDPLGLLSPCIIKPKVILQSLWLSKIGWDDPVPIDIKSSWEIFANNLDALLTLEIPRRTLCESPATVELHSFSDASQSAYGACVYLRSVNNDGDITVKLLCAKSKVAPIKPTTIPRLELSAALLSARLVQTTTNALRCQVNRLVHWCDSTVVLGWLRSNSRNLKTFVANRVVEICELTNDVSWRYVPTDQNPADLISRGVHPHEIKDFNIWWSGPTFLTKSECEWPQSQNNSDLILPEMKSHATSTEPDDSVIKMENYSKLTKLKRVTAYVLRFANNIKNPKTKTIGDLTTDELTEAFNFLCLIAQKQSFADDYSRLIKNIPLNSKSSILSLSPFMDDKNLIRVGGRIDASSLSYNQKHPVLLHSSHHLTKLIFSHYHIHRLHAGPQLLLASVREHIWPINGRRLARSTAQKCVICRRFQGKTLSPIMGNLPAQRITPDFPFRTVGVDFAGPFMTLNRKGRGARLVKTYLCLFICFRYKCLHLEAVSDLTSNSFILTLRRMISRRGKPLEIFCDNGRNFVGAANEIGKFLKQNAEPIFDFATQEEIKFVFSPVYAPNFGGIWEAGVKSAKFYVKRVMGNTHLTFEELTTLFAQVEAILNSRPLCPLSSSPDDFLALTPGHFLIGRPLTSLPAPSLLDHTTSSLSRYARIEQIRQHFWKRWQKEYISELQQRCKWRTNDGPKLQIGDLVLIHEENLPPLSWRMGRIIRMLPGRDGVSRVVDIRTANGIIRRSLTRVCPLLPSEESDG